MRNTPTATGTALITGGAQRLGGALARALASYGYDIALHYHTARTAAQALAASIHRLGRRCQLFPCDLMDEQAAAALIPTIQKKFSKLTVLINNASIFEKSPLIAADSRGLEANLQIHLKTPRLLMRAFARQCRHGVVINMLDAKIGKNKTAYAAYLLSKKALAALTTLAAVEMAPAIRVNGIAPGLILPPRGESTAYLDALAQHVPLKKRGALKNITEAVIFLIENDYVTGQILYVDGGAHLV